MLNAQVEISNKLRKQISISGGNFAVNAVTYVVPAGKTFSGSLLSRPGSAGSIIINGQDFAFAAAASSIPVVVPLSLVAGTVIKNASSSNNYLLVGVEE